jgi:ferrochelatase
MMQRPADHPVVLPPRIGVLLVNLGTPDAPEPDAVRRYLKQFLSDPRVVEIPPLLWQPVLRTFVLATRPQRSAEAYRQVWTPQGSPLSVVTQAQAEALQAHWGDAVVVDWAMRYGQPDITTRIGALMAGGCDRILIAPLYPQYSGATTATVFDDVAKALGTMRLQPALRFLPAYHDDPAYIDALKRSIEAAIAALPFAPDVLVASFHSMPERTLYLGDPYHCQCQKTARLLSEALDREIVVGFQSKLGRAKWLEPSTEDVLAGLPGKGIRRIAVVAPGFSADNLETLEEVAIRGKETFVEAGGTDFAYVPCLNASEAGVAMLATLLSRELEGWLPRA